MRFSGANTRQGRDKERIQAVIVIGNAIEKDASLIREMSAAIHSVPVKI